MDRRSQDATERSRQAQKRRAQQLKRYAQWCKSSGHRSAGCSRHRSRVRFSPSIVLLEAAARNGIDEVRRLLQSGVNPDTANEDGLTALHQSCIDNSESMCRVLLDYKANVNARDSELWTPLHAAATCGHLSICRLLINSGADLLALNADGSMPYDICEDGDTLEYIEQQMASRGVTQAEIDTIRERPERQMLTNLRAAFHDDPETAGRLFGQLDAQGANTLHVACANGYLVVVGFLLDLPPTAAPAIEARDRDGWTPVHVAACWGHVEVVEALALRGANLDAETSVGGQTMLELCDDPDLRQRLEQVMSEARQKLLTRVPSERSSHSRKASINRSASVRRSSMREKTMLSKKEAQLEAMMLPFNSADAAASASVDNFQDSEDSSGVTIRVVVEEVAKDDGNLHSYKAAVSRSHGNGRRGTAFEAGTSCQDDESRPLRPILSGLKSPAAAVPDQRADRLDCCRLQ